METKSKDSADILDTVLKFFISLRLTVVLLLTLAMTSIIGMVLPQNESEAAYRQTSGRSE